VHVVQYKRVKHARQSYGGPSDPLISGVAPLHPITNLLYFNLEKFADVIVEVPENSTKAEIRVQENPKRPNWFRYHRIGILSFIVLALGGFRLYRGGMRWDRVLRRKKKV